MRRKKKTALNQLPFCTKEISTADTNFSLLLLLQVDTILEFSNNQQTKYYALQILESVIKTRWKVLPRNQCEGIKKYIVGLIIKTSSDPSLMEKERTYLNKLNMILVQVLNFFWKFSLRMCQKMLDFLDIEARMAKKLGKLHSRHHWRVQDE